MTELSIEHAKARPGKWERYCIPFEAVFHNYNLDTSAAPRLITMSTLCQKTVIFHLNFGSEILQIPQSQMLSLESLEHPELANRALRWITLRRFWARAPANNGR